MKKVVFVEEYDETTVEALTVIASNEFFSSMIMGAKYSGHFSSLILD